MFNLSKKIEEKEALKSKQNKHISSFKKIPQLELQDEETLNSKWIRPIMFIEEISKMYGKQVDSLHRDI